MRVVAAEGTRIDTDAVRTAMQQFYEARAQARAPACEVYLAGSWCPCCRRVLRGVTSDCDCKFAQYVHTARQANQANEFAGVKPCMDGFRSQSILMKQSSQAAYQEQVGSVIQGSPMRCCGGNTFQACGAVGNAEQEAPPQSVGAIRCIHGFNLAASVNHRHENSVVHISLLDAVARTGGTPTTVVVDFGCILKRVLLLHWNKLVEMDGLCSGMKRWLHELKNDTAAVCVGNWHVTAHVAACLAQ